MQERTGLVTMRGNAMTLVGREVNVGEAAPDFVALDNTLTPVKLSSFRGRSAFFLLFLPGHAGV